MGFRLIYGSGLYTSGPGGSGEINPVDPAVSTQRTGLHKDRSPAFPISHLPVWLNFLAKGHVWRWTDSILILPDISTVASLPWQAERATEKGSRELRALGKCSTWWSMVHAPFKKIDLACTILLCPLFYLPPSTPTKWADVEKKSSNLIIITMNTWFLPAGKCIIISISISNDLGLQGRKSGKKLQQSDESYWVLCSSTNWVWNPILAHCQKQKQTQFYI